MAGRPVSLDEVAAMALALPGVSESEGRRGRSWSVGGKSFAWERPFSKADIKRFGDDPVPSGPILGLRLADLNDTEAALAAGTRGVFTIPHFDGYAAVLVQLDVVTRTALRNLLRDAWEAKAPAAVVEQATQRRG